MSWDDVRKTLDLHSDNVDEWQGFPVPVAGIPLRLHDSHPLAAGYREVDLSMREHTPIEHACGGPQYGEEGYVDEHVMNSWFSWRLNCDVTIIRRQVVGEARAAYSAMKIPRSPAFSMDRLTMWIQTLGASDAWDINAEHKAREKLRGMLTDRQWQHYDLTGSFLETSPRSRLTYVFRRLRPTLALSPRGKRGNDVMRCLAVLCMHPIGYYERTWAGCLVPSDDVIAHLAWMRGDEAGYWRVANQHEARSAEAGL